MFSVTNYGGILEQEKKNNRKQIVVMLLVKPSDEGAEHIINKFNYLHHRSKKYCSIYAVGYSENSEIEGVPADKEVDGINGKKWYYSDACFVDFQETLEERLTNWNYSGDPELIIAQSDPESKVYINFSNSVTLNIGYAIKNGYIESFPNFMERLIRAAKEHITAREASKATGLFSIKDTVERAFMESDKVPKSAKRLLRDAKFYKACNSKSVA